MFGKIVFATSGAPDCDSAARVAFDMAGRYGSEIIVFHCLGIPGKGDSNLVLDVRTGEEVDADEEYLEGVREELRTTYAIQLSGCKNARIEIAVGNPSREVLRIARKEDADLVVMGARGEGMEVGGFYKRGVIGGTHDKVAKAARCPVLTVARPAASFWGGFSNIVFATDFSKASDYAFQFARNVASDIGCTLHLVHGVDVGENANQSFIETKVAEAERKMQEKYVANMGDFDNYKIAIREGAPHVEVLKYAREAKADLIVMAHHTREVDPEQAVLGSTIEQVVLRSACPVLSVNHPDKVDVSPYGPGAKSEKAAA